jgi:hypothetical protein
MCVNLKMYPFCHHTGLQYLYYSSEFFHNPSDKDCYLLRYNAVQSVEIPVIFQRNMSISSGSNKSSKLPLWTHVASWPWRWRRYIAPNCRLTFNRLHRVIYQKKVLFITTALRTSDPTKMHVTLNHFDTVFKFSSTRLYWLLFLQY